MSWRWLFNQFADPHLSLTREQKAQAMLLVHRRLRGRLTSCTLMVMAPPLIAIGLTRVIDDWVAAQTGLTLTAANLSMIALVVILVWPWSAWAYGRLYTRPYGRALRQIGIRICEGCGYPMESLPKPSTCPECGQLNQ